MKKNFFFMAALLVAMVGCNKEPQEEGNGLSASDKVYMSFSIKTPTTRSATENDGTSNATPDTEVGKDYENNITKVDIVLINADQYIVADDVLKSGSTGNKYIASFNSLELKANKEYEVYIYANCDAPAELNIHATSSATIDEMTQDDNFWMTNAYAAKKVKMPANMSIYTSHASPFNLGVHSVERSMARIDIKPVHKHNEYADNVYVLKNGDDVEPLTIALTQVAIINHNKSFYKLRRVSEYGTDANWIVGGLETPDNYVVDGAYKDKYYGYNQEKSSQLFDSHLTNPDSWEWFDMPTLNGEDGYKIWKYCKENTIPAPTGEDIQQKGLATCIVFKGEIFSEKYEIEDAMEAGHVLFLFENVFYGPWHAVKGAAAQPGAPATLVAAVEQVESANIPSYEIGKPQHKEIYEKAGFTGFSRQDDASGRPGRYYTYYYYWIRHNDNGDNAVTGPMEFAVVRNNVYKLCVENIYKLGHPTPGKDPDPNPEDPSDPIESLNYYFNVTMDVLPWTVRVNNIEF